MQASCGHTPITSLQQAGTKTGVTVVCKSITDTAVPVGTQVEVSPDKVLTIRAERKDERDEEGSGQTRRTERQYGVFVRRFQVSSTRPYCGLLARSLRIYWSVASRVAAGALSDQM